MTKERKGEYSESRYIDSKREAFLKDYPLRYRVAVLKVFVDFISNEAFELGRPKRIIEEFYSYGTDSYDDLMDLYYKKIENIKARKTKGIDDHKLFFLIQRYVLDNSPDKLNAITISGYVDMVGNFLSLFLEERRYSPNFQRNIRRTSIRNGKLYKRDMREHTTGMSINCLQSFEMGFLYKVVDYATRQSNINISNQFILVGSDSNLGRKYKFVLVFDDSYDPNIFFGVYSIAANFILMRSLEAFEPLSLSVKAIPLSAEHDCSFVVLSNSIFHDGSLVDYYDFLKQDEEIPNGVAKLEMVMENKNNGDLFDRAREIASYFE